MIQYVYLKHMRKLWSLGKVRSTVLRFSTTNRNASHLIKNELEQISPGIRQMLNSNSEFLEECSKYYTIAQGKQMRPSLVLLMSKATSLCHGIDRSVVGDKYIDDDDLRSFSTGQILPSQLRLAQITEMIHIASLLHDDVIDHANVRRGSPSSNVAFGNRRSILAGNFILARASTAMARLRNPQVTELLATVIADLVRGEFLQLKNTMDPSSLEIKQSNFDYYIEKSFLKTASLISKSCKASTILGQCSPTVATAAGEYGRCIGTAFQLMDDVLDYTSKDDTLGKAAGADLKLGLATAPVLFAWKKYPELGAMIVNRFNHPSDIQRARSLVECTDAIEQTITWAKEYIKKAKDSLLCLPDSPARKALFALADKVITRKK
ncbi:decaprenyl diphosphate synthase subunit Dps1 [Schizosaccharomyces pombe]|uniref:Decaprenyl-diphosphate synthase subunit 1 n=1 Tax=Schizosaccharomyces pombe (strain 972 / ATCC 24843) TaxID=284812 RepID=DPS1_SCHPO|nr:decaprenyl diphosphate synthase subunit Dps1 [Schizosaccharomyces pombe]O43091.1 RecName: Full=Decaprenyl-diphosphate synthase subunit 1; AltName: Full=All-trans-decaprenyl-diphosphate synthase subunit 1; AltName: Full=Decaprenyl pyrophosphate synthase subunit 1 [Schizosaccharomyces pombe 972h-]BAA12314.1 decaprenyl diphosphate synthase subunit 1 [Schizosaccharomyces pombe]CAB66154.1 decaprenyl diphosphate synthase subunit Dps1 [Schizosaccharomyces pombe]|eukprot:NP_595276.1 decaprenyl diphosphate synthase subunit Dps1 [Schizosaccharomyces pombe]